MDNLNKIDKNKLSRLVELIPDSDYKTLLKQFILVLGHRENDETKEQLRNLQKALQAMELLIEESSKLKAGKLSRLSETVNEEIFKLKNEVHAFLIENKPESGKDGEDGKDGVDGADGKDGVVTDEHKEQIVSSIKSQLVPALEERADEKINDFVESHKTEHSEIENRISKIIPAKDQLEILEGDERLDASAIKNLPKGVTGAGSQARNLWQLMDVTVPTPTEGQHIKYDATTSTWINSSELDIDVIEFNTDYVPTETEATGTTFYDETNRTISTVLENGVVMQHGQEMPVPAYNNTGVAIADGIPVYVNGRQGHIPTIALARSDADSTASIFGLTTSSFGTVGDAREGYVTTKGLVRGIKTNYSGAGDWGTTWAVGDKLYVSKTIAGQLTNVEPATPHHADVVGIVSIVGSIGTGSIDVGIIRHITLEELSDVNGTALNTSGQLPVWDNDNSYFDFTSNINDYDVDIDTRANILATNTAGRDSFATDTLQGYVEDGTKFYFHSIPMVEDIVGTGNNPGTTKTTPTRYNDLYTTDIDLFNSRLIADTVEYTDSFGDRMIRSVKVSDTQDKLQYYTLSAWQDVLTGFEAREGADGIAEFKPSGTDYWVDLHTGNSDDMGLNGRFTIQEYEKDPGSNPARRIKTGKFYDGTAFTSW